MTNLALQQASDKRELCAPTELLIVDQNVENTEQLLKGLARQVEVVHLDEKDAALDQIARALSARPHTDTLHILSHGEPGALALAGEKVDTASIGAQSAALSTIKSALGNGAKVALWACSTAAGAIGKSFTRTLEAATGADVFASLTPVGNAAKGGTWDIGIASPFGTRALAAYPHTLPTFDFTGGTGSGTATYTETESGVTITVVDDDGDLTNVFNAGTAAGLSNEAIAFGGTGSLTVTFDEGVTVTSFRYVEDDGSLAGTDSVIFTPTGGTGTTITKTATDFANSGFDITPTDWVGVTGFTVTYTGGTPIDPILDTIVFNVAPTVSGEPTDIAFTEDTAGDVDLSAVTVADGDGDSLTVTLSVDAGTFSTPADGALVGAGVTETLVNATTITLAGTAADINTYLDTASNIQYTGATDAQGNDVATLTITPNDGTEDGTAATVNIDITNVNDAPTITGLVSDIALTEDTLGNINLSASAFADVDTTGNVTVTLTASEGTFSTPADGVGVGAGVTETLVNATTVTLVGTVTDINTYLNTASNITYTGATNDNGADTSTITITINDGEGSGDVALGTVNLDITAVNDDPTISGLVSDVSVTEETAGNLDLSASNFADVDSAGDITVTLAAGTGTMAASDAGGVVVGGTGTGTLTLTGTVAEINTYLNTASNVQYTGATDVTGNDATTVSVTANDGDGSGDVALGTVNIDITGVNDDPTVSGLVSDIALTEDTLGNIDLSASAFADVDTTGNVTVTLTASEGTFATPADGSGVGAGVTETLVNATTITLVGTVTDINTYLNTASNITYTGATNDNGADTSTITITINDGEGSGDVAAGTVNLDITAVNDDPTASDNTVTIDEDTTHVLTAADFGFSDVDSGDMLASVRIDVQTITSGSLQLSGTDVTNGDVIAVADINAGNLVYTPAADANGNGLLSFTFSVNDGTSFAASTSTLTVDVADVSDNANPSTPVLSNTSVSENAPGAAIGTVTSTDPDGDTVNFGTLGDDRFEVVDGVLKLRDGVSLDFEEEETVRISVRAFDEFGGDTVRTFTITVDDVVELVGSSGNDTIMGGDDDEDIESGDGNDTISSGDGRDTIDGGAGDDSVSGGGDDDLLTGGEGNDFVDAGSGNDLIFAGMGDNGADTVEGDAGQDSLGGGAGNDSIDGGTGNDIIWGAADNDTLGGDDGNDQIFNGTGDDTVSGGVGDDTLWGGAGDDELSGGAGADTFIFGATSGNDTVTDFDASEDMLDLQYAPTDFADLAAVQAASSESTQDGESGVSIDLGGGQSIFLEGLSLGDLASINLVLGATA